MKSEQVDLDQYRKGSLTKVVNFYGADKGSELGTIYGSIIWLVEPYNKHVWLVFACIRTFSRGALYCGRPSNVKFYKLFNNDFKYNNIFLWSHNFHL